MPNKYAQQRYYAEMKRRSSQLATIEPAGQDSSDENKSLIKYLIREYGNPTFIIEITDSIISLAKRFKRNNRSYQTCMSLLQHAIPAGVFTSELFSKIQAFREMQHGEKSMFDRKTMRIVEMLGVKKEDFLTEENGYRMYVANFDLGREVSSWMIKGPDTKSFKIIGIYQPDLKMIDDINSIGRGEAFVVIKYKEEKFVWEASFFKSEMDDSIHFTSSQVNAISIKADDEATFATINKMKNDVFKEFVSSLDVASNVIVLDGLNSMSTRPRVREEEPVNQFNLDKLEKEIEKVLSRGKKRGYSFVGIPGTGKTSIIRWLEARFSKRLVVHITPTSFSSSVTIKDTFNTIRHLQPCIVIIEDMDSFDFAEKNSRLACFLEEIDDIHQRLNAVIVSTVNDTNLVHYSLMNRPGRTDQVYMLNPPSSTEEVYGVLSTKACKEKYVLPSLVKIDRKLLLRIIKNKFTQADICEVINKMTLLSDKYSNKVLVESIKSLEDSKKAIDMCKFHNKEPDDCRPEEGKTMEDTLLNRYIISPKRQDTYKV